MTGGSGETYTFNAPTGSTGFVGNMNQVTDAFGNITSLDHDSNGAVGSVTLPTGDNWGYEHDNTDFPTNITKVTAPGGNFADVTYGSKESAYAGKMTQVITKTPTGTEIAGMEYEYGTSGAATGKLITAKKRIPSGGYSKQVVYEYDDTAGQKITVYECSGSNINDRYSRTEYIYGQVGGDGITAPFEHDTWVIKKYDIDPNANPQHPEKDQKTVYALDSNRTGVISVTGPDGIIKSSAEDSYGRPEYTWTSTADGKYLRTHYEYHPTTSALTTVTVQKVDSDKTTVISTISTESYTYYNDAGGNPTAYLDTHTDVRGSKTRYVRDTASLWQVDAVQVWKDSVWHTIKEYEYYTTNCTDGMAGQVKKEIVPDVGGAGLDQVTEYKYGYGQANKWRTSPTTTIYKDASGTSRTTTTEYDDAGRALSTTDANLQKTEYTYDNQGRQTDTVYKNAQGTILSSTHNEYSCCTLLWSSDENGNKTYYDYDSINRLEGTWTDVQGDGTSTNRLVTYTYDSLGNKETVTTYSDANTARVTGYSYDANNRVTKIVYPTEGANRLLDDEYFQYDAIGRLTAKLVGVVNENGAIISGKITAYEYDDLGRLMKIQYEYPYTPGTTTWPLSSTAISSEDVWYVYEGNSSLKSEMHDTSGTSYYTYDEQGRLESYTPPRPSSHAAITYTYNNAGQKTSVTNGSFGVTYDYYANGWLKEVKRGVQSVAQYNYDAVGNRSAVTYGNGTSTVYSYDSDPRYRISSIIHKRSETELATIGYNLRDSKGNPVFISDWTGTWSYAYDDNNRLDLATPPVPVPEQPAGGDYGYDWVGNRLSPPTGPNNMVYSKADQLTLWPGMHSYTYYGDGSLKEVKDPTGTNILRSYSYNPDDLLSSATYSGRTSTFTWDGNKNRVGMVINGEVHSFVYDTTAGIPAVIEEANNSISGISPAYYIREPDGALIGVAHMTMVPPFNWYYCYYHFDELGSTRLITDGSGNVTDKYTYDAWGGLISHQGTLNQPYQYVGRLGYYTHWQDSEFSLLQLGVRFYDTHTGSFTQRDPIRQIDSPYSYCHNHVTTMVDPTGLWGDAIRVGLCAAGCRAVYEATKSACVKYASDKAYCIAAAYTTFAACTAGCYKLTSPPPPCPTLWYKDRSMPIDIGNQKCTLEHWGSNKGGSATCLTCWAWDGSAWNRTMFLCW